MKKVLLAIPITIALLVQTEAANVILQNFDEGGTAARPLASSTGAILAVNSGSVSIGTFNTLTDAQITALGGPGRNALLADFAAFANSVTNPTRTGNAAALDIPGLYAASINEAVNTGDPRIGKSIYTLIGNGTSLATSNQIAVVKDEQTFALDAPLATAQAYIYQPTSVLLIGTEGPLTTIPGFTGSFNTLQLAVVPEPSSLALLGLCGLLFRRRR
jgi:hypothetical protein